MRISDWSSDVCSSDLASGVEGPGAGRVLHRRADGGRQGGPAQFALRQGHHDLVDGLRAVLVGAALRRRLVRIRIGHHTRSEEHTSELQSLMRISYAVFCLKKKKTQTSNTNELSTLATAHY